MRWYVVDARGLASSTYTTELDRQKMPAGTRGFVRKEFSYSSAKKGPHTDIVTLVFRASCVGAVVFRAMAADLESGMLSRKKDGFGSGLGGGGGSIIFETACVYAKDFTQVSLALALSLASPLQFSLILILPHYGLASFWSCLILVLLLRRTTQSCF